MTRFKYNYNTKFAREHLLLILYQQTVQSHVHSVHVGLLLQQLEDAYMLLEQANVKLEEVRKVGGYTEVDSNREVEENASEEEEVEREEEDNNTKVQNNPALPVIDIHSAYFD